MRTTVRGPGTSSPAHVERLVRRVVHPMVGLDTRIGFLLRGRHEPPLAVAGAELTGVHRLMGKEQAGSYHIGGVGLTRSEALVRAVGESVERYSQLLSVVGGTVEVRLATVEEARSWGRPVVDPEGLRFFTPAQHARPGFPFSPAQAGSTWGWAVMQEWGSDRPWSVPAQLTFVGYTPHSGCGERWLMPAVTTGTATHRTRGAALRGALLELIQIDTAMGHWYGRTTAPRIVPGRRLSALTALLDRCIPEQLTLALHHLPSPDLPGHSVAAVLTQGERRPVAAVGLGCETRLVEACYKAVLEAVGVFQLARMSMSQAHLQGEHAGVVEDESGIYDLDRNVGHYADGGAADALQERFPAHVTVADADLPTDLLGGEEEVVAALSSGVLATGARLFERDLTTVDGSELGMVTVRVWSPDLLPLAMPSAPPLAHPRFVAHGGVGTAASRPHPYP